MSKNITAGALALNLASIEEELNLHTHTIPQMYQQLESIIENLKILKTQRQLDDISGTQAQVKLIEKDIVPVTQPTGSKDKVQFDLGQSKPKSYHDWQLDGSLIDMNLSADCLVKDADPAIKDPLVPGMLAQTFEDEKEWSASWNPLDPHFWYFIKPIPGQPKPKNTHTPPNCFHPESLGIQIWNAVYNIYILTLSFSLSYAIGAELSDEYLKVLSYLTTGVTIIDMFFQYQTAILNDEVFETRWQKILESRLSNGKLFLDLIIGIPWILLSEKSKLTCAFHLIAIVRTMDDRCIYKYLSISKIATHYGLDGSFVAVIKAFGFQFLYWSDLINLGTAQCVQISFLVLPEK